MIWNKEKNIFKLPKPENDRELKTLVSALFDSEITILTLWFSKESKTAGIHLKGIQLPKSFLEKAFGYVRASTGDENFQQVDFCYLKHRELKRFKKWLNYRIQSRSGDPRKPFLRLGGRRGYTAGRIFRNGTEDKCVD